MNRWRAALAETAATMVAAVLSVGTAWLLAPEPGSVVLGGILALSLSRSQLERDARGRLEAAAALPVIGIAAAAVGSLLLAAPIAGAAVYIVGLVAGVWVRRFGPVWRRLGAILMLPFVALLVAPASVPTTGPLAAVGWLVPVLVPLIAFVWVTAVQLSARALGVLPIGLPEAAPRAAAASAGRLRPSDRAAIQLAVALVAAFLVGFLAFSDHWAWVVLTVVVVLAGATGRADALFKGASRLVGAAAGSTVAFVALASGEAALATGWRIAIVVVAIAFAVFGRRFGYVWWALWFTIALSIVQSFGVAADGSGGGFLLWDRLLEILVGAVIAVAAAWFVVPLVSERTILRRIADVLAALQDAAASPGPEASLALDVAIRDLAKSTEPYDFLNRWRPNAVHPRAGRWIVSTRSAVVLARDGAPADTRRHLGEARKALREPDRLQSALDELLVSLD